MHLDQRLRLFLRLGETGPVPNALSARRAARLPVGAADGVGADPAAGRAGATRLVGRATLLPLCFFILFHLLIC